MSSRLRICFLVALLVMSVALIPLGTGRADWAPEDGHKMHFPQLPDEAGWDVNATQPNVLADDWQCSESGWVKDIHFWGSWRNGNEGQILSFVLSIHADIPADQSPTGYSMPGATLWEREVIDFVAVPIDPPSMEGWYDPATGEVLPDDHQAYFQYNVVLPEADWFWQEEGTIYWLNISAILGDVPNTVWGWKSTQDHWNDDAVWAQWGALNWVEMYEPDIPETRFNEFFITIDPAGQFVQGGGTDFYGAGWYYYPMEDWWNIWFYDHPFSYDRYKNAHIEFDVFPIVAGPGYFEIAVNWSTDLWSLEQPPGDSAPPLPGVDELRYIGRQTLFASEMYGGHYVLDWTYQEYNPEWVSIDVRGYNFDVVMGFIEHVCLAKEPQSLDLSFVITGGAPQDTCDYHKSRYPDYVPQGMPDFDMKQSNWQDGNLKWSHDGPTALANCLWWFDSKFEPNLVVPPAISDGYTLLTAYGPWDDHAANNVQPFVADLATNYVNTNPGGFGGTNPWDLQSGLNQYLVDRGLRPYYTDVEVLLPPYETLRDEVLASQDVILHLSFYEDMGNNVSFIGSHYVTVAGCCTQQRQLCISDPWLDALEGEPPAGSAHGGTVHNDPNNISGPHGQIQHDPYTCTSMILPGGFGPVEVINYPVDAATLANFEGMNLSLDWMSWQGGTVYTVIDQALIICPQEPPDTCDYYKAPDEDYAPNGMPDFDQKQDAWTDPQGGSWSHCGPVALANCLWWFDSRKDGCTTPPPAICNNYPLIDPFGPWDDHDANNVIPFVDSLAKYCKTNTAGSGTIVWDLATGASDWMDSTGVRDDFTINVFPIDPAFGFEQIREEVLISQDVILLLGFYEEVQTDLCERIGGHYVTVAGTCTNPEDSCLCISDPYFDAAEGEPPAGSAHGSAVHNDAFYVSGPHGTRHHDWYQAIPATCVNPTGMPFAVELPGYPIDPGTAALFLGQNQYDPTMVPVPPQGGPIHTLIEFAVVICPTVEDTCAQQMPGDADNNGVIDIVDVTYLTAFIYTGGPAPWPLANGDPNGDCKINIGDIICLTEYLGGQPGCLVDCTCVTPDVTACCYGMRGNVDYDVADKLDIADLVYFVEYSFGIPQGPAPPCTPEADVDGGGGLDIADIVYLVDYMFGTPSGPAPLMCP